MSKERPQISFISILHKIKDLYQRYDDINTEEDLENLIYFYEKKESYSKRDLQKLQIKCSEEWKEVLLVLCESIKNKIGKSKNKQKLFGSHLRKVERLRVKIEENNLELEDYENIFYNEIEGLKDSFDSSILKHKLEWKRFWFGLIIGFVLGIGGVIVLHYVFGIG